MNENYITINEINKYLKDKFDNDNNLKKVYLKGEISNFKYHTRGHLYFSLKDDTSKINAVMFEFNATNLNFIPKDGDSVLVSGRISIYETTGSYQIYVESMKLDGTGDLYRLFEILKESLHKEGLFNEEHKLKIPKIPQKIGIITASTGAAVKDIISTINRRYPLVETYLFPSLVQGALAKDELVKMINEAQKYPLDVIILGRGGGSIEDLWPFNEEIVARAIYNCKIPIISAVGHEIDFTISDFVADKRAPTPTGAAEMAVPNKEDLLVYLDNVQIRCKKSLANILSNNNQLVDNYINRCNNTIKNIYSISVKKLEKYQNNYLLNNPKNIYIPYEQRIDNIYEMLNINIKNIIDKNKYKFNNISLKLELINPVNILKKGYSIAFKDDKVITDKTILKKDDDISIKLFNCDIDAKVKEVRK